MTRRGEGVVTLLLAAGIAAGLIEAYGPRWAGLLALGAFVCLFVGGIVLAGRRS